MSRESLPTEAPPHAIARPAWPPPDGCGPAEALLAAVAWRAAEGRGLPDDHAAAVEAARTLWARGADAAWLAYASAVVAYAAGRAQSRMIDQEAA